MRILLDTHALIWFFEGNLRLPAAARGLIADRQNLKTVSIASLWEMAIKISIGKLTLSLPLDEFIARRVVTSQALILPVEVSHLIAVCSLPFHHKDPFDRLLIAQALTENIPLISADAAFDAYGVQRIWD